jgi:hypothetical protein
MRFHNPDREKEGLIMIPGENLRPITGHLIIRMLVVGIGRGAKGHFEFPFGLIACSDIELEATITRCLRIIRPLARIAARAVVNLARAEILVAVLLKVAWQAGVVLV